MHKFKISQADSFWLVILSFLTGGRYCRFWISIIFGFCYRHKTINQL